MEFDCFQPYFFDHFDAEEDFYKSTAPSEDIWKKFELLPTPPMSPHRTLSAAALYLSPGDQLSWLTKVLDEDCEGHFLPDTEELLSNASAHIIKDCMWSSFPSSKQSEKEKVSGKACGTPAPVRPSKAQCASPGGVSSAPAVDCVDPAAVLTFPASSCRKPASSGSESRSDSSDDEEEIDVVTVESKQKRVRLVNVRKPVTIRVRADPCPKRFHMSVHRQQHNYAARSPDSDLEPEDDDYEDEPHGKRVCPASPSDSTPQSSDVEDTDRRKNHNFLERKRRNDLRSRFLALRDQVPGLEAAKAPKVAILTQATEYLMELHTREKRHLQEKKRLKSRQQQLLRKLSELKRS
ncbi:protein L-Myc-1b-like [Kryptolebias marmoratus]|uniref:MYCL proto-oncogene, bHLH transcription factor a n=1 Tax=Kryptolebias marmoratus TaxID=37003 RepID=A0A3Q3ATL0_KRYMA|nr:protein L-Myc-1b-like [Kryptolebias marmoratus]